MEVTDAETVGAVGIEFIVTEGVALRVVSQLVVVLYEVT
jgi:hypothetical protein